MGNMIGQLAQIAAMVAAIFFALLASSGLVNLYLRYIDKLSIDREDGQAIARNSGFALLSAGVAALFHYLPLPMALAGLLCGIVVFQILKINGLLKIIERI